MVGIARMGSKIWPREVVTRSHDGEQVYLCGSTHTTDPGASFHLLPRQSNSLSVVDISFRVKN